MRYIIEYEMRDGMKCVSRYDGEFPLYALRKTISRNGRGENELKKVQIRPAKLQD